MSRERSEVRKSIRFRGWGMVCLQLVAGLILLGAVARAEAGKPENPGTIPTSALPQGAGPVPAMASLPQGVGQSWMMQVQQQIQLSEYEARPQNGALSAPNRAQGLRLRFQPEGLVLGPRTSQLWSASFKLLRWGRADAMQKVASAQPQATGSRVEYRRGGALTEWYVNQAEGVKQGFTIAASPRSGIAGEIAPGAWPGRRPASAAGAG